MTTIKRIDGTIIAQENLKIIKLCEKYRANLSRANLYEANLSEANLSGADLSWANLYKANLYKANLYKANLYKANLSWANLYKANLYKANLYKANLYKANLSGAENMVKIMGVIPGNLYYKRFGRNLINNDFPFFVGLNILREGEVFADDERVLCSSPGFHFASRSWCAVNYPERPLEALIKIPEDAKINEPWATDGKASADKIEILQVWDVETGEDVTEKYRRSE